MSSLPNCHENSPLPAGGAGGGKFGIGRTSETKLALLTIFACAILSLLFGLLNYPIIGHDSYVHLDWLEQFTRLREQGILYPHWMPLSFGGFGSPAFYFYPPLTYFLASFVHSLVALSAPLLFQVVQLIVSLVAVLTAWLLLRQYSPDRLVVFAGALLYGFVGYHFVDVYIRNALGEHVAMTFLPLVFIGTESRIRRVAVFAFAWSALLLSNLPIAFIGAVSAVVLILATRDWSLLLDHTISGAVAVMVSAFYLLPAWLLRSEIHASHLSDLDLQTSQFGYVLLDIVHGHIDWLRIVGVVTIAVSVWLLFALRKEKGFTSYWWCIAVAVFLQVPFVSLPIWKWIPLFTYIQFAWRWDAVLLVGLAVAFVMIANRVNWMVVTIGLFTILCALGISRNLVTRPPVPITKYHMDAPEYAPESAPADPYAVLGLTERRMSEPDAVPLGLTMPGDTVVAVLKRPKEIRYRVQLSRPTPVRFHMFYWPLWEPSDTAIALKPDVNGFAIADLPAGSYALDLKLGPPPGSSVAGILSLIGVTSLVAVLLAAALQSLRPKRSP